MNQKEIKEFLIMGGFDIIVDATHPFAKEITGNIQAVLLEIKTLGKEIQYLRLKREMITAKEDKITYFETKEECAKALYAIKGNILLTTGSKELDAYCVSEEVKKRLYVRVLPSIESISLCIKQGICGKQIIAMQGPFSTEMNEALIYQYKISCLVTKESGVFGGFKEKLEAAKKTGIKLFVIKCPKESIEDVGYSFSEICKKLEEMFGKKLEEKKEIEIILAGIGMGHKDCLTKEVEKAVEEADILLGAERMLEAFSFNSTVEKHPFYQAKQIIPYLYTIQKGKKVVILFSGDSGFYSGCQGIYRALKEEIKEKNFKASLRILPGISSVVYLASCIGESYQDAAIYSLHGKRLDNLINEIKNKEKTFFLTSGRKDIHWLGESLLAANMTECEIIIGYQLSYKEQRIEKYTPLECCKLKEEGLYTCFIRNLNPIKRKLTHGIRDQEFLRDYVPMTKEEIREVSICKLRLQEEAIVYDIGSGTGSIAMEIASLSNKIQVYAIEKEQNAISLIEKNKKKFELENIKIIKTEAPEGLSNLPTATHAFIGGSNGKLKEILKVLREINPEMRVVVNAICIETICEIKEFFAMERKIEEKELVQLQVNRVKEIKNHHLMQSENPVWICAFHFCE